MNRRLTISLTALGVLAASLTAGAASARPPGWPAVDTVTAGISMTRTVEPTISTCLGGNRQSPDNYVMLTGSSWSGTIDDGGSMMHPYPVRGSLDLTDTTLVSNHNTGMSVLTGTLTVTDPTTGSVLAKGSVSIPTRVDSWSSDDPVTSLPVLMSSRGVVSLQMFTSRRPNGTTLVANVGLRVDEQAGTITGSLGDVPEDATIPGVAFEYNDQTC